MVHFENALVTLRAVVTPIRLCPEAPLAHPDASVLFPFKRFESDVFFLGYERLLLSDFILCSIQGTRLRFDILVVEVRGLFWILLVFLYFLVREVPKDVIVRKMVGQYLLNLMNILVFELLFENFKFGP